MGVTFSLITELDLPKIQLGQILGRFHQGLLKAQVRFELLFASNGDEPALRVGKLPTSIKVKVMPLVDRVAGYADVRILLDQRDWDSLCIESQEALLDHGLTSLHLIMDEEQRHHLVDDIGRPKLRCQLGEIAPGQGFTDVIARHGPNAIEYVNMVRAFRLAQEATGAAR